MAYSNGYDVVSFTERKKTLFYIFADNPYTQNFRGGHHRFCTPSKCPRSKLPWPFRAHRKTMVPVLDPSRRHRNPDVTTAPGGLSLRRAGLCNARTPAQAGEEPLRMPRTALSRQLHLPCNIG
jgi:hypothetical protein